MNVIWEIILLQLNFVFSSVVSCGDPGPVANGIYVGNDFTYNHTIIYHCNPGHLMEPAGQGTLCCTKEGAWNQTKPSCKGKSSQSPAGQTTTNFSLWNDDVCTGSELQEHLLNGFEPFQSTNRFHEEYIHYKVRNIIQTIYL